MITVFTLISISWKMLLFPSLVTVTMFSSSFSFLSFQLFELINCVEKSTYTSNWWHDIDTWLHSINSFLHIFISVDLCTCRCFIIIIIIVPPYENHSVFVAFLEFWYIMFKLKFLGVFLVILWMLIMRPDGTSFKIRHINVFE